MGVDGRILSVVLTITVFKIPVVTHYGWMVIEHTLVHDEDLGQVWMPDFSLPSIAEF